MWKTKQYGTNFVHHEQVEHMLVKGGQTDLNFIYLILSLVCFNRVQFVT